MGHWGIIVAIAFLALLLVSAGIQDARTREIANWKNAAIALAAPLWWWGAGYALWPDVAAQIALALVVLILFAGAFHFGWMGGGDVKMLAALALWMPPVTLVWTLILMSLIGGVLTVVMMIEARIKKNAGPIEVPYGVAIALAALLWVREPIFN